MVFDRMSLWIDPQRRPGPEAMAVDEWLLETTEIPVLRIYGWLGDWGSVGYFGNLSEARHSFPTGIEWVRRWTGGGTVDHRDDWTYTVIAPAGETLAGLRGAESYRLIHDALADTLRAEGLDARLSTGTEETGAALCFENPVSHDLISSSNAKLAGAGQRRTSRGLLHQGSVTGTCEPCDSITRAERLARQLAGHVQMCDLQAPDEVIAAKVRTRYAAPEWTERR